MISSRRRRRGVAWYNTTTIYNAYNLFKKITTATNSLFTGSLFLFEGYAQAGVKAPGDDATTFTYRSDNILATLIVNYTPDNTVTLDQTAHNWETQMRAALWAGATSVDGTVGHFVSLHSYVNYAYGDETQDSWYGEAAWHQARLKTLKSKYDLKGVFSFYAPIKV
ncbi:hypothetical protein SCUCBS95973_008337 [Sporothrix curviconia]|uniref:Berberine/berberine-like domain-containing protein n=1 Tax=Sporothrix curviconia TaxID=1260050 RepID=A0ABP0CNM6_9PEZI